MTGLPFGCTAIQANVYGKRSFPGKINIVDLPAGSRSAIAIHDEKNNSYQVIDAEGKPLTEVLETGDHVLFTSEQLLGADQEALITNGSENELYCYRIALGE